MIPGAVQISNDYANRPCYPELIAIIIAGAIHISVGILVSVSVARIYNAFVSLCFLIYVVRRASTTKSVLRLWGMRRDNFWTALRFQLSFGAFAAICILGVAMVGGSFAPPKTFWLTLALYPVWGIAQQFALHNLVARNLSGLLSHSLAIAFASAILFGLSHTPRGSLVFVSFFLGFFFTLIYQRFSNLWAVGIVHGILGTLALYFVVGEDPGARILTLLLRWQGRIFP